MSALGPEAVNKTLGLFAVHQAAIGQQETFAIEIHDANP
jgi:hypothetical protein